MEIKSKVSQSDPTIEKLIKTIGKETREELDSLSPEDLKQRVVQANQAMKQVKEELQANPNYQELRSNLLALTQGMKDVNKRQRAIIAYALTILG